MPEQHLHPEGRRFESSDYSETHAEKFAARYDDGIRKIKSDKVLGALGDVQGKAIVDLGCGIGYFANALAERGATVVACDFAESMVRATASRYPRKFPVVRASVEAPPLTDDTFDAALLLDVFEHLYDPEEMLRRVFAILKPGGTFVITTDRPGSALGGVPLAGLLRRIAPLRALYRRFSKTAEYTTPLCTHVREYAIDDLLDVVTSAGFTLTHFDTYPNRRSYGLFGALIELTCRGPLRRYKWNYAIYVFSKP